MFLLNPSLFIFAIFMDSQRHNGLYRARLLCEIHLNISDQCIVLHKGPADGFVSLILGFRRDSQKSNFKIKFFILADWLTNALNIGNNPAILSSPQRRPAHTWAVIFSAVVPHYQTLGDCRPTQSRPADSAAVRLSSPYSSENITWAQFQFAAVCVQIFNEPVPSRAEEISFTSIVYIFCIAVSTEAVWVLNFKCSFLCTNWIPKKYLRTKVVLTVICSDKDPILEMLCFMMGFMDLVPSPSPASLMILFWT